MTDSRWVFRKAQEEDLPFIYSTWGRSFRYGSMIGKSCRNSVFYVNFNRVIDHILEQDDTKVTVACLPADPSVILGYLVSQPDIIHYVFVKSAFTKFGIAKSLYNQVGGGLYVTHQTNQVIPILDKHRELIYNPFILFKQKQGGHDG